MRNSLACSLIGIPGKTPIQEQSPLNAENNVRLTRTGITEHNTNGNRPRSYKLFLCSTQLSMKFVLLINLKAPTIANSFLLNIADHENISLNK